MTTTFNYTLLVNFTGSDWCGWCIKLVDEVFKHGEFQRGVSDKFVLVEVDFPSDKSKLSEATRKQNADLKRKYGLRKFTTILLLDAKGLPYAKTGYRRGGPVAYLTHLGELQKNRVKRDAAFASAEKLEGVEKAKALVAAIKTVPEDYQGLYQSAIDEITKLDPEDQTTFTAQQKTRTARKTLEEGIQEALRNGNAAVAITMIDTFIKEHKPEGEAKQEILAMKINPLLISKDFGAAEKAIDQAIKAAPESRMGKGLNNFKKGRFQKMKAAQ